MEDFELTDGVEGDALRGARKRRVALLEAIGDVEGAMASPAGEPSWYTGIELRLLSLRQALDQHIDEVEGPEGIGHGTVVAVRIRGDSMHPMRDGWLLFYRRDQEGVPDDCLNRLCIVKVADDGPLLVKELHRGYQPNRYLLASWNAPPMEDVSLDWAAAVLSIRP